MSSTRPHPLRDLALALSTLTVLPMGVTWPEGERTDAPGYYPLVGLLVGAFAYAVLMLFAVPGWNVRAPLVVAACIVALLALSTRMLHWDGLGDVADAFGAHDRARRLEIMGDSSIGAFGVTAIALCVVIQTASLAQLVAPGRAWALVAVPVFSRLAATFAAWFGKPARTTGLGASVIGAPRPGALVPAALTLALVAALNVLAWSVPEVVLTVVGVVAALVVPHLLALRFGGVTGDVMGASVVVVETVLFAFLALWL